MPPALSVPTNLRPLQAFQTRYLVSEDEDEDDEEDMKNVEDAGEDDEEEKEVNQEEESHRPPPSVSRDILQLGCETLAASPAGRSEPPLALAADVDAFNPDWTPQDLEYTSLGFGQKTASFVCKSISFGC
jgi:hypothetical protein